MFGFKIKLHYSVVVKKVILSVYIFLGCFVTHLRLKNILFHVMQLTDLQLLVIERWTWYQAFQVTCRDVG